MESKYNKDTWIAKNGEIYVEETGKTIALIPYFDDENEEEIANAELISASPDMLKICETISDLLVSRFWLDKNFKSTVNWRHVSRELQDAINKATGGI